MRLLVILALLFFCLISHLVHGKEKNVINLEDETNIMNGDDPAEFVTQPMYAIGSLSQSYENYQVYFFPEYDIPNFISAYNNLGGLPSLGVYSQTNCLFNVVWNGIQQESCQCPASSSTGSIQQVIAQNSALCQGSISDYVVEPVTTTT
jgi:hypothetical protein